MAAITKANQEQAGAGEQIARSLEDVRAQMRETASATAAQAKAAVTFRSEMAQLSQRIAGVRAAESLANLGPGSAPPDSTRGHEQNKSTAPA